MAPRYVIGANRRMQSIRLLLASVLTMALIAGCGDGNDGNSSDPVVDDTALPPFMNFHEQDFAEHPRGRATGGEMLMVDLEDPYASSNEPDTGASPGVDAIPVTY